MAGGDRTDQPARHQIFRDLVEHAAPARQPDQLFEDGQPGDRAGDASSAAADGGILHGAVRRAVPDPPAHGHRRTEGADQWILNFSPWADTRFIYGAPTASRR